MKGVKEGHVQWLDFCASPPRKSALARGSNFSTHPCFLAQVGPAINPGQTRSRRQEGWLSLGHLAILDNLIDCDKKGKLHDPGYRSWLCAKSVSTNRSDLCLLLASRTPAGLCHLVGWAG